MIIITENKKQHYIIKNFLAEISIIRLNENESYEDDDIDNERHHVGFYPIININKANKDEDLDVTDKEIITQDQPVTMQQLNKASKIKPKMKNLAKLVASGITVSILAAASYFASDLNNHKVTQEIAKDNNISVQKVIQASPQIKSDVDIIQSPTQTTDLQKLNEPEINNSIVANLDPAPENIDSPIQNQKSSLIEKSKRRIKTFEGFKPYPYKDKTGVSIGFGTFFINNVKPDNLPDNWLDTLYEKCEIPELSRSKYENKTQDELFLDFSNKIEEQKTFLDNLLEEQKTKLENKNKELKKWQKIRNPRKRKRYTDTVKAEIEHINKRTKSLEKQKSDLEKEKNTAKSRGLIPETLAKECLSSYITQVVNYHTSKSSIFGNHFFEMDENVQIVVIDMSYNIGMYFLTKEYTEFSKYLQAYIKSISTNNEKEKVKALKNMWEEIKDRSPDYHKQQSKNKRAQKNTNLLKQAYEIALSQLNENKYSLKSAYNLLYN